MTKPSEDLLEKVKTVVQARPSRVPTVVEAILSLASSEGQARAAIEHLVQHGELEFDVQMNLRPAQS